MRYLRAGAAVALLGVSWILGPATSAGATGTQVVTHIEDSPDNGCPPWARDSMARTTTILETEEGTAISFHDEGEFVTSDGRQGTLSGDVVFETFEGSVQDDLPDGDTLDNSDFDCKPGVGGSNPVPTDRTVGQWPLRYVDEGPAAPGLTSWEWTYTLCGTAYVENEGTEPVDLGKFPAADSDECAPEEPASTTTTTAPEEEPDLPANCDEVALLPPQYWPHLDADRDGVSCEDDRPEQAPPATPRPRQPTFTG